LRKSVRSDTSSAWPQIGVKWTSAERPFEIAISHIRMRGHLVDWQGHLLPKRAAVRFGIRQVTGRNAQAIRDYLSPRQYYTGCHRPGTD
jgi:hypothetical protein